MNDEIKEINIPENVLVALSDLTNGALNYYKATETVKVRHNTILDYITNLQEENKKLKSYIKLTDEEAKEYMYDTSKKIDRLQERIDKAVEFIRMHDLYHPTNEFKLLCILKGSDKK